MRPFAPARVSLASPLTVRIDLQKRWSAQRCARHHLQGRGHVTGTHARLQPDLTGRRRTHKTAPDRRSYWSEAVSYWCSVVDPTYQHANRLLVVEGPTVQL
jgi:hypothetical protein